MIVVDSNVIAYCWLNGEFTPAAQAVRLSDPEWHAPILWRSELRSILAGYLRQKALNKRQATAVAAASETAFAGCEHIVDSQSVLDIVATSALSAYDAEFVALASQLRVPLVTEDRAILREFPRLAVRMRDFATS